MKKLNIYEAKTHLSRVLAEVENDGQTFLICRNGRPIAQVGPCSHHDRLAPHPVMRRIKIKYDPAEPLTDDEWPEPT